MCLVVPAGGMEEPIFATAGAAGRHICRQSSYLRRECRLPALKSFAGFPACSRSPCCPAGLENTQNPTPVLLRTGALCAPWKIR